MAKAKPNVAHRALADLEARGLLHAVITQNVDCLHQKAGSQRVLEVHGDILTMHCLACHAREPSETYWPRFLADGTLPRCPCCDTVLKPGTILYGEVPPHSVLSQAQQEALCCDLMIIAGSSLEVMPAADLPRLANRRGAALIIINREPTPLDRHATLVMRANVTAVLPKLVDMCRELGRRTGPKGGDRSIPRAGLPAL
jgi:NAD-dependent deacetylase